LVEVLALKKEEGDAVLKEEGLKDGSWAPSLSAFTALDSFMGRGRMGGEEEVGEIYTEGDVFAEEDWGPPIDNSGEKERDDKGGGDKDGDGRRRSKRDSKITPRMAAFMGKENRGSKAKAAATTRHDGGGREEVGESNTEGDVPATTSTANPSAITHVGRHPYVFSEGELVNVIDGKASHQANIVSINDEMATVKWKMWKGQAEVEVNQLRPICDGSKRKRKQTDRFGQPWGDMTDGHSIKKLKPATTVAMPAIKCYVCGANVWPKHGKWIGCFDVEKNVHVCVYCKSLEREKQDRLEKGKTVKSVYCDSSDEEEKGSAGLAKGESVKDMIRDHSSDEEEVARKREAAAAIIDLQRASAKETVLLERTRFEGPVREKEVVKIDGSSGALTTLIDVMEREGVEGRESFLVREYWRPNRLASFKTFATPLLYMGRKERKIAPPNKSKIDIAEDHKLSQRIRSRVEVIKIMRLAEEWRMVVGATTMGKGSPLEILASHEGDSVKRKSMQTLRPGIWLNDEVINYFLKNCLKNRDIKKCAKEQGRRRSHFFNSFFVQTCSMRRTKIES
jgi:hypothetical protein